MTAELRRAEAHQFDIKSLLTRVVAARGFDDAQDVAAVVHDRIASEIAQVAGASRARRTPRLVVGLIPTADGPMAADMRRALIERAHLMEARARAVFDEALLANAAWTRALGAMPRDSAAAALWQQHGCTIAAYRDRYGIVGVSPLGQAPQSTAQQVDAARARAALRAVQGLTYNRYLYDSVKRAVTPGLPPTRIPF